MTLLPIMKACPIPGRFLPLGAGIPRLPVMDEPDLAAALAASTGLSAAEAARVVEDVLAWYREPVEQFVRRRHAHYQLRGVRNAEAFALIAGELERRLVAPPALSERQLRRIVYG